jgi:hypothetical protein
LSDRNAKQDFEPVNGRDVLEKVAALSLSKWSFKTDASTRHIGPMAQDFYGDRLITFAVVACTAVVTWAAWAMLAQQIGTRLLSAPRTSATWGELLRTTGFAAAPGFLQVFAVFPGARTPIFAATGLWMFAAMVVGVRHALDYRSTARALAVCALAVALSAALAFVFSLLATTAVA